MHTLYFENAFQEMLYQQWIVAYLIAKDEEEMTEAPWWKVYGVCLPPTAVLLKHICEQNILKGCLQNKPGACQTLSLFSVF